MRILTSTHTTRGVALVELIIYLGLLAVAATVVVGSLIPLLQSYSELATSRAIVGSADVALERFVRESRTAVSVDVAGSTFGAHPGMLILLQGATTTRLFAQNGRMYVSTNGIATTSLTGTNVSVSSLVFSHAPAGPSEIVRARLTLTGDGRFGTTSKTFHAGAVLRGAY